MIPVNTLLYKIDQKLNALSSNTHQQIPLEDKILTLNEAQIKLIKQKLDVNNVLSTGLDGLKKRYEDIQTLVEDYENHPLSLILSDKTLNKYSASLDKMKPEYMFYADSYILADKDECKNRVIYVNKDLTKHADVTLLLNNTNYKPSFEYQETFGTISSDYISIYTDGTFSPKTLYLSYIRYPLYIDVEGYIKLDGKESTNQDCELNAYLEDELTDLAVQMLAMYTGNQMAAQSSQLRINNAE